jgi:SMODS and SLOG-associating 2TM effector domain family 4
MTRDEGREYVLATARQLYGRAVWSQKTHEKDRELWSKKARRMNHVNIILVSATTLLAIISAALRPLWLLIITAVFSSATTAFVLWQSSFDPVGKENYHRTAAKELLRIREQLMLLIERCHISSDQAGHLQASLESIMRELTALYKFAPDTSREAYALAGAALNSGELTLSDEAIDAFLPAKLRNKQASEIKES